MFGLLSMLVYFWHMNIFKWRVLCRVLTGVYLELNSMISSISLKVCRQYLIQCGLNHLDTILSLRVDLVCWYGQPPCFVF